MFALVFVVAGIVGCSKHHSSPTAPDVSDLPNTQSNVEQADTDVSANDLSSALSYTGPSDQCGNQTAYGNVYPCCTNGGNCTWWAWKRAKEVWGVNLPNWGNPVTWTNYARNAGYKVSSMPAVNTIAVRAYGHVAWVTKIISSTQIEVSEMNCGNYASGWRTWKYSTSYFDAGFIYNKSAAPDYYAQYDNQDPIAKNCAGDAITVAQSNIYRSGTYVGYVELRWSNKCGTNWARTTRKDGRTWEGMVTAVQRSNPAKNVRYSASGGYIYGDMVYARNILARACGSVGASGWYCTAWK